MQKYRTAAIAGLILFLISSINLSAEQKDPKTTPHKQSGGDPSATDSKQGATSGLNKEIFTNSLGMKFVKITSGSFMMGSGISPSDIASRYGGKEEWYEDDIPQHKVTIRHPFFMQTMEVTVGQWRLFVKDTGYKTEAETAGGATILTGNDWKKTEGYYWDNPGFAQTKMNPVTCVSWNDVQAFIEWLNRKEGKTYRLPTEAEWEYACRAGSTASFSFGDDLINLGRYAWYWNNANRRSHPVGKKEPNPWNIHDIYGNVWEWCQDWYGKYPSGPVVDPTGPSSGTAKVFRGGSAYSQERFCRSAYRGGYQPDGSFTSLGFRLVSTP